jgi:hypothetical protein
VKSNVRFEVKAYHYVITVWIRPRRSIYGPQSSVSFFVSRSAFLFYRICRALRAILHSEDVTHISESGRHQVMGVRFKIGSKNISYASTIKVGSPRVSKIDRFSTTAWYTYKHPDWPINKLDRNQIKAAHFFSNFFLLRVATRETCAERL